MKKICFIADSIFKSGGMQRVIAVIAEELTKYYDVTIVSLEDPQQKDLSMFNLEKYPIKFVFTHFPELGGWKRISYNVYDYLYKNILPKTAWTSDSNVLIRMQEGYCSWCQGTAKSVPALQMVM